MVEDCRTCKHRASKNYYTIRCDIWTPKIKNWLKYKDEGTGRMCCYIRCQYYERGEFDDRQR